MNRTILTAILISLSAFQSTAAMEATATARDVQSVDPNISVNAQNAAVIAAISKVNKDMLAVLHCNKINKFYKPADSTADAKGCVGATIQTTTTNHTVALGTAAFKSYPSATNNGKGYNGSSTVNVSLKDIVAAGAKSISVKGSLAGFTGGCSSVSGNTTMNIANVKSNVADTTFNCKYDSSPNRTSQFSWSYNASNNTLRVRAKMSQVKSLMTSARVNNMTATYQLTKTVLKVGDGK